MESLNEYQLIVYKRFYQPDTNGFQVRSGALQSIASSSIDNCAVVTTIVNRL